MNETKQEAWNSIQLQPELDRISAAKRIPRDQLSAWFENAFFAYRLANSDEIRCAQGRAIAKLAVGLQTFTPGRSEVVLGAFEYDGSHYWLVPFLLFDGQRYILLNDGVSPSGIGLAGTDYLPPPHTGQVNRTSPRAVAAVKQSVLNSIKEFDVYRYGRKVGHFSVTGISVVTFDLFTKVAGNGVATGFDPEGGGIALAGPAIHAGFWPRSVLTAAQKDLLRATAMSLIPKVMPQSQFAQKFSGKPLAFGQPSENSSVIELSKGGASQVSMELTVPIQSPGEYPGQFSAYVYLLESLPNGMATSTPVFISVHQNDLSGTVCVDIQNVQKLEAAYTIDI